MTDDRLVRRLFAIVVGVCFFYAFLSLGAQIEGLVGANGILPAAPYLAAVEQNLGGDRFLRVPTWFWFVDATDVALVGTCVVGLLAAIVLMVGRFERVALAVAVLGYLSLSAACRQFLWYQWDILLIEVGVVTMVLLPSNRTTHPAARWLTRLLLFKLMFSSGFVKLGSGDETWRALTALNYHYETQPLPTAAAWYAHHLPDWFQQTSVALTFVIQLVVPFGLFGPRRVRFLAATVLAGLQVLIAFTGNYCFFNLLTLALCLLMFDDAALLRVLPDRWRALYRPTTSSGPRATRYVAIVLMVLNVVPLVETTFGYGTLPESLDPVLMKIRPWRVVNGYGLFAVMTTKRREIVIEGSNDGTTWHSYELPAKPGDLAEPPRWVAPHQPRVDWQLWFASLGDPRRNVWLVQMMDRMLEGSPQVLGLFAHDPFGGQPPRRIRARMYDYRFTTTQERRSTGHWWRRVPSRMYVPARSL